ncbi:MAG: acyl-homoserine-lactone acylase [Paracoccaceae bacterium]|jgi:acyl-homoserine-lactone acylase
MTQLLKDLKLKPSQNFMRLGQLSIIGSIFLLAGCSEQPASLPSAINESAPMMSGVSVEPAQEEVSLRWTSHGIPHVKADSWEGLGYGFAHAVATNTVCVLAKELITVRGETAKYFGDTDRNINADTFHKALLHPGKINEYLASASQDNEEMDKGYAAGYNNFLAVNRGQLPASCNNADWVKPIDVNDLAKLALGSGIRYGLGRVTAEIATAAPGMELASLDTMDLFVDPDMVGSNALAFGSELTDNGRGVLLGNPHYPWHGASRFHMAHLTLPGEMDVMGVGLISTQRIAIGFTEKVAWTHTVSTALRFTMFRLDLVAGDSMSYRFGDEERAIEPINVDVETENGLINRTAYMTHLGPVVVSKTTPWSDRYVYVMRDVNYENYRSGDQYRAMQNAQNVSELRDSLGQYQAAAFVNTIAADSSGGALYADMSAIPNVSAELIDRCEVGQEGTGGRRAITLNGSDPSCDWQVDPSAAYPGLMPPSQQPSLISENYVSNMNDSYWLSNPDNRLEGYSPIIGNEQSARSLRTRAGLKFVGELLKTGDKFSQQSVEDLLFSHRHYGAELFLDDVLTVCNAQTDTQVSEACEVLSQWDRRQDIDSVGAHIFNEFWSAAKGLNQHYAVPFDLDDPINTPRGLTLENPETLELVAGALSTAVGKLNALDIPMDAKWGDVQFAVRNGEKIGIPGGSGRAGMFSVITSALNDEAQGYSPITHGNSYIQTVTWNDDGTPNAEAILTYSQSPEPDSPHYSDLTKLYSKSEWIKLPFTEKEIEQDLVIEQTLRF